MRSILKTLQQIRHTVLKAIMPALYVEHADKTQWLYLPRTLEKWPWPRAISPYYLETKGTSRAWFHKFNSFDEKSKKAFDKCDFELLAALAYPRVPKGKRRAAFAYLQHGYTDRQQMCTALAVI